MGSPRLCFTILFILLVVMVASLLSACGPPSEDCPPVPYRPEQLVTLKGFPDIPYIYSGRTYGCYLNLTNAVTGRDFLAHPDIVTSPPTP